MHAKENIFLPYTLGFAAITTAAIVCLTSQQTLVPSKSYDFKGGVEIARSWDADLTYTSFERIDDETLSQFRAVHDFAEKLYDETTDLDPKIVEMVDENFWDLLA